MDKSIIELPRVLHKRGGLSFFENVNLILNIKKTLAMIFYYPNILFIASLSFYDYLKNKIIWSLGIHKINKR